MGRFFTAVKRRVEAMGETPVGERYVVGGKAVSCGHCTGDRFVEGRAQLNTAGLSFLNLRPGHGCRHGMPRPYGAGGAETMEQAC
jgi:hypothetical protein